MADLFSYVVKTDAGFAPNPDGGFLSLACCKPKIRKYARVGDWVMGTHRTAIDPAAVCWIGEVAAAVDFGTYGSDPRFLGKHPTEENNGDSIYYRDERRRLKWRPNRHHPIECMTHDTSVDRVLLFNRFWYFGPEIRPLPPELVAKVVKRGPSHRRIRGEDVSRVVEWASSRPEGRRLEQTVDRPGCIPHRKRDPKRLCRGDCFKA